MMQGNRLKGTDSGIAVYLIHRAPLLGEAFDVGQGFVNHFSALEDPRQSWKVVYPLPEIMLLVLCGTLAAAEDFAGAGRSWISCARCCLLPTASRRTTPSTMF